MTQKLSGIYVAVLSVLLTGTAVAAEDMQGADKQNGVSGQSSAPGVINAGGFEITPTLGLSAGTNDNVGLSSGAVPKTSSSFTILRPSVAVDMPTNGQVYSANYSGAYANYTSSSQDNYNDQNFGLAAKNDWTSRVNSLVNVDYKNGHDGRNAMPTGDISKELWHTTGVKAMAHYGADGAQGQFELTAGQLSKRYDTNLSGFTQILNYDATPVTGAFFYKVAPATHMIFQAGTTNYSYQNAAAKIYDSKEQQYMVGVKWEATAKTTGNIRVGTVSKSFSSGFPTVSSPVWNAAVAWSPRTYSVVNFALSQAAAEAYGVGSSMISRDSIVNWTHEWSSYVKSMLSYDDGLDTFQFPSGMVFKRQTYEAKLSYAVNRRLNAGVDFQNWKRSANVAAFNYTQSIAMIVLDGSL